METIGSRETEMDRLTAMLYFLALSFFIQNSDATWLWMGVATSATRSDTAVTSSCSKIPGLSKQQLRVCHMKPDVIPSVSRGANIGISECKRQFMNERWNCTTSDEPTVFGRVLDIGSKETAFVYAITSAGVVHAVSKSCSLGNLSECTCESKRKARQQPRGWKWAGCSDNVNYGMWLSKTFVDSPENLNADRKARSTRKERALMNLHNNEAGRQAVLTLMRVQCRCHGVSNSCAVKTCSKSLPNFNEVGIFLKDKYREAVKVMYVKRKRKLKRKNNKKWRIPTTTLVYTALSPNYCNRDTKMGIAGTSGRKCNKDSRGVDSCDLLCCGSGYNTQTVRETRQCSCRFIWCCRVQCKTCERIYDSYTCK